MIDNQERPNVRSVSDKLRFDDISLFEAMLTDRLRRKSTVLVKEKKFKKKLGTGY